MSKLTFSYTGLFNHEALRSGQISNKLTGSHKGLSLKKFYTEKIKSSDRIIIVLKQDANDLNLLNYLKNNYFKIILDIIDRSDPNKYNIKNNINNPNFFPDIPKNYYDGYIVSNNKMKDWWYQNIDNDRSKPIFVIPHHIDDRFYFLPTHQYDHTPYFYYLGVSKTSNDENNCHHISKLLKENLIYDHRYITPNMELYFKDKPINGVQLNIRTEGSFEFCFKPATKLLVSSAMDSLIITTYDWSIQDILPEDYPYLIKSSDYDEVKEMIKYVKDTFQKEEWFKAKEMLEQVKNKTTLNDIIKLYLKIEEHFGIS